MKKYIVVVSLIIAILFAFDYADTVERAAQTGRVKLPLVGPD